MPSLKIGRRTRRVKQDFRGIGPYFHADAGGQVMRGLGAVPVIPGLPPIALPAGVEQFLSQVPELALVTPWGEQVTDVSFQAIPAASLNVALYAYGEIENFLQAFGLGQPGWVAVYCERPLTLGQAAALFTNTPYKFFSGLGVYNQADKAVTPRITFLYWGQLNTPGAPGYGDGSLDLAAQSMGGKAVWAFQLDAGSSSLRAPPAASFQTAYAQQFGPVVPSSGPPPGAPPLKPGDDYINPGTPGPGPGPSPVGPGPSTVGPVPGDQPPAAQAGMGMGTAIGIGFLVSVATFLAVKGAK